MTIPKIVHFVWPGRDEKKGLSKICIQTWKDILPSDWEIKEWNLDSFDFEYHKKNNRFFREVCERKLYAFIADYVRAHVLYEHGGIYLDTDISLLKPFDENMLNQKMILAIQNERLVEPAVWACEKGHPFAQKIRDFYDKEIWNCSEFVMPDVFAKYLQEEYKISHFKPKEEQEIFTTEDGAITFYPEKYFIPYRYGSCYLPTCIEAETTTIHWFRGSWTNNKKVDFLRKKTPLKVIYPKLFKKFIKNLFSCKLNLKKHDVYFRILGIKIIILEKDN